MPDYNTDSLINGIEACKKNIIIFEKAIEKERNTITEYYDMIEVIKKKELIANSNIVIKAER